jgi:hypothetical protein
VVDDSLELDAAEEDSDVEGAQPVSPRAPALTPAAAASPKNERRSRL